MVNAGMDLSRLLDDIDAGVFLLDASGRIVSWNHWLVVRSGLSADQAIGRNWDKFLPSCSLIAGLRPAITDCLQEGRAFRRPWLLNQAGLLLYPAGRSGGGEPIAQDVIVRPVTGDQGERLCLVQVFDASPAAARDRALREAVRAEAVGTRRLQAVLDSALDAVLQMDEEGRIIAANRAAHRMFGFDGDDLTGLCFSDLVAPVSTTSDHAKTAKDNQEGLANFVGRRCETTGVHRRGIVFSVEFIVTEVEAMGWPRYCAVIRDITARKRAAQERELSYQAMKRQAQDMSSLAEHLELARSQQEHLRLRAEREANRSSDFLALVGHELRTPLNAILGFAEILEAQLAEHADATELVDYAGHIKRSGTHLLGLINDILDLARVETGTVALQRDWIDPVRLVRACLGQIAVKARARGVRLNQLLPPTLPRFFADERLVRQMLMHLLNNAVKFTQTDGTVRISVSHQVGPDAHLVFSVIDTGIGMSPSEIELAMHPFSQVSDIMTRHDEGLGLGLPLVKALAELHGGRLILDSAPHRGTTATLHFPMAVHAPPIDETDRPSGQESPCHDPSIEGRSRAAQAKP